jgi:hypothetical protein
MDAKGDNMLIVQPAAAVADELGEQADSPPPRDRKPSGAMFE